MPRMSQIKVPDPDLIDFPHLTDSPQPLLRLTREQSFKLRLRFEADGVLTVA